MNQHKYKGYIIEVYQDSANGNYYANYYYERFGKSQSNNKTHSNIGFIQPDEALEVAQVIIDELSTDYF